MQLAYAPEVEAFRAELSEWLEENRPDPEQMRREPWLSSGHFPSWARTWQQRQFDDGWLVPGWPPERGGRNASVTEQLVYHEEIAKTQLMRSYNPQGLSIIAPSILDYGSDAQKERFVLPTLRAEIAWALGMSEPGAGSDLAGLATRAEVHDDRFVVRGQKIWTSGAQHAQWCFCFVRTDPDAPKHRGISVVLIDLASPGITVRPLPELTHPEHADFNEVFFEDVEVPRANLVGELNHGWSISAGSLAHERGMVWLQQAARLEETMGRLRKLDGDARRDPRFRDAFAALWVDASAMRFMGYRGFAKFAKGNVSPEHSVMKLFGSEISQSAARLATEYEGVEALDVAYGGLRGYDATFGEPPWFKRYLQSYGMTISAGTSEIQRNIIAQRVLGLPRR